MKIATATLRGAPQTQLVAAALTSRLLCTAPEKRGKLKACPNLSFAYQAT